MSRVSKTIKNAKFSVFFFLITAFLQFFSRKIFLEVLGDEFIGLTGTLQGLIGFLNLAELGIGTAIGVTLYKPLYNKDYKEINNVLNLFGFIYNKIGIILIVCASILSLFFPLIFDSITFSILIVYYLFTVYVIGSLLSYFYNYHLFVLQADQKGYVVTSYYQSFTFFKVLLQVAIVYYSNSVLIYITLELLSSVLYSYFLRRRILKEYPWINIKYDADKTILKKYPEIIQKFKQISVHKISSFITNGTDQILIFILVNIESVAFYGNYQLIFVKLISLVNNFFSGTSAGIGNLVAENNPKNIHKVFWEMMAVRFFIAGLLTITLFFLVEPFITVWLGDKYILDHYVLLLLLANFFILLIRVPVDDFKNAYALFADTWAPIAQSTVNLLISFVFGSIYGITGILLGTFISLSIIILFWRPYYLYKFGFKNNISEYWSGFLKLTFSLFLSVIIIYLIVDNFIAKDYNNFYELIIYAIKIGLLILTIYSPVLFLFNIGFRNIVFRFKNIIKGYF